MVDDMDAYLKDFKQKMQTRGNDDTMALDEAAWHLSSIANYDFGNVDPNFKNFHYDTLYYNINVENGRVSISDLNALYTTASADIAATFQNLDLENKHIYFIGATIEDNGTVCMSILSTYGWINHQWYFPDPLTLYTVLSPYFDTYYTCDYEDFTDTLESVLNTLAVFHLENDELVYIVPVGNEVLPNSNDPYGSPNAFSTRIFYEESIPTFTQDMFFYYFDSYAGLGIHTISCNTVIIHWSISRVEYPRDDVHYAHEVTVYTGVVCVHNTPDPPVD